MSILQKSERIMMTNHGNDQECLLPVCLTVWQIHGGFYEIHSLHTCDYNLPGNSNSQKKLGVCENWVFTCRFRCFRRFSQKLVVFWGLHSLAYTDQFEVTQRLYGRFLPLIMVFCEQILGLWGKTEPCRDLLFHTSMAKEVGMWPSEFTQHE